MSKLTEARQAVWLAIEEADSLSQTFKRTLKYEKSDEVTPAEEPEFSALPAIAIRPLLITPEWKYNKVYRYPYRLLIRIWTAHWVLPEIEKVAQNVVEAIRDHNGTKKRTPEFQIAIGPTNLKGPDGQPGPRVMRADIQLTIDAC